MQHIATSRLLYSRLKHERLTRSLRPVFQSAVNQIVSRVLMEQNERDLLTDTGNIIEAVFVGDGRNAFGRDGITPLATFPSWLNSELANVQAQVVMAHTRYMRRHTPPDVLAYLETAHISEQRRFLEYTSSHEWLDERGYKLSDRIWQGGVRTRAKLDALIRDAIRDGRGSLRLSRELESFLIPGRALRRTNKPYGSDASFDALRLARTEIARAHAQASAKAAQDNPYVNGMDVALASRHKCCDECDDLTTIGADGERKRDPYPMDEAILPPYHPHCICVAYPVVISRADVVEQLRRMMRGGEAAPMTPALPELYLLELLGSVLMSYVAREVFNDDSRIREPDYGSEDEDFYLAG